MPRRLPPHPRERDETVRPSVEAKPAAAPESKQSTLAGEVLRLQRLVGNTAVTSLIARAPLQRDEAGTAEAAPAKGGEEGKASSYTMKASGIGDFPLESLSWGVTGGPGAGTGERKEKEDKEKGKDREGGAKPSADINATKASDEFSVKLMERAAKGTTIDSVEIELLKGSKLYLKLKLKNVHITNFQMGSNQDQPFDSFSLTADSVEFEYTPEGGSGGGY